jgi:hypothetical protein
VFAGWLDDLHYTLRVSGGVTVARITELRLARVAGSGALASGWPAEGVLVRGVAPESLSFYPSWSFEMLSDGAGGAFLAWADSSGGSTDTRLWRYGANGAPAGGWAAEGVTFTPTALFTRPMMVADESGGLYAAWTDSMSPPVSYGSPKLLHLESSGVPATGWPIGGLKPAGTDMTYHWMGGIASDGVGGVYAQMSEVSASAQRVRLVRRTANAGVPAGWTAQGLSVEFPSTAYPQVNQPIADARGGVHMVMGLGPMPSLNDVRVTADGTVAPGWSLESPHALPLSGSWWTADVLGDGRGTLYVVGSRQDYPACEHIAWQLGTRDSGVASVSPPAAARIALTAGPNPSPGTVEISFALPRGGDATVEVFEIGGRRVRAWRSAMSAGAHRLAWDGRSDEGEAVAPGLYFVLVGMGDDTVSRRVAIVR